MFTPFFPLSYVSSFLSSVNLSAASKIHLFAPFLVAVPVKIRTFMFVAADGYKTIQNPVGQILAIFLPVVVFILSGFEHCVANMYFFTIAGSWSIKAFGYLIIMSLGNSIGGILIPLLRKGFVSKA